MSHGARCILVTGAGGRLGSTVAARLHDEGADVVGSDVIPSEPVPYPFVELDLLDHDAVRKLVTEVDVDVIAHIGNHPGLGRRAPQDVFAQNVTMNANVFQAATEAGVERIVFASTLQMLGSHVDTRTVVHAPPRPPFPFDEHTSPQPANLYALSKVVSETMLRYYAERCGLTCVALRLPLLHRDEDWVEVSSGHERPDDVFEGFTGLTYDDAAALFSASIEADVAGFRVYLAGTAHRHRELGLAELIAAYYPDVDADTAARIADLGDLVDVSTITAETGWTIGAGGRRPHDSQETT